MLLDISFVKLALKHVLGQGQSYCNCCSLLLSCQIRQIWIDCVHVCTVVQPSISAEFSRAHSMLIMLIGRIILTRVLKCIQSCGGICMWVHWGPVWNPAPGLGVVPWASWDAICHLPRVAPGEHSWELSTYRRYNRPYCWYIYCIVMEEKKLQQFTYWLPFHACWHLRREWISSRWWFCSWSKTWRWKRWCALLSSLSSSSSLL